MEWMGGERNKEEKEKKKEEGARGRRRGLGGVVGWRWGRGLGVEGKRARKAEADDGQAESGDGMRSEGGSVGRLSGWSRWWCQREAGQDIADNRRIWSKAEGSVLGRRATWLLRSRTVAMLASAPSAEDRSTQGDER